ncbi:MAG: cytochrome P460 family protein [Gammaproteobacteria bacterium]|nr:cytochrome P460 family protein [Gammaproteobacteria bacterium]
MSLTLTLVVAGFLVLLATGSGVAAETDKTVAAEFNASGELIRPEGWREWIYIGAPLTPNSLNPPKAAFPEFHSVYIDPASWAEYKQTGKFREGTVIAKELSTVGATEASSGNGFFMGEFSGYEIAYKSAQRFPDEPGNWAYFSFGHEPPYNATAKAMPTAACAACHQAFAAEDMVFTQYYPILGAHGGRQ